MAILLSTKAATMEDWRDALLEVDPGLEIRLFPDAGDPAGIEAAVVWTAHDMAELRRYPNLRLIVSMGAGVDHLMRPPGPPPGIPVARLVDTRLTQGMTEWVLLNVLRFHRQDAEYRAQQAARIKRSKVGAGEAVPAIGSCKAASSSRHGHVHAILCPGRVDAKGASPAQGRCQADVDRFHCLARYRFTSVQFVRWG